jgi:nucleoside-diphosphate-sugar epimerase
MDMTQHHLQGKHIAILGAGWLGIRLAEQALRHGMHVSTLTRNQVTTEKLRDLGVHHPLTAQLHEATWHGQLPREQDFVVNCVSSAGGGIEGYRLSYMEGNRSVLAWAGSNHPATFIYTGSTSVYPQVDGQLVDETASTEGASESGQVLLEAEGLIRGNSPFARSIIFRLGGLYGPGRHYILDQLREEVKELPGSGDSLLNLLHLDDACSAIWATLSQGGNTDREAVELFNVTDGNPSTKADIVEWLAGQLGRPAPFFNPNSQSGRSPIRRSKGKAPNRRIDNRKIRVECGWSPAHPTHRDGYRNLLS